MWSLTVIFICQSSCGHLLYHTSLPRCLFPSHFSSSQLSPAPQGDWFVVSCCWATDENYAQSQLSLPVITLCGVCEAP